MYVFENKTKIEFFDNFTVLKTLISKFRRSFPYKFFF